MSPNFLGDGARALPEHPNLEHLKSEAKARLRELRLTDPSAKLTQAQFQVARSYGFSSWRALKASIDRLNQTEAANSGAFTNLIGHYRYDPAVMSNSVFTVSAENERLYIQLTGRARFEILDKGDGRFSMAGLEGHYAFENAEAAAATALLVYARSHQLRAERTSAEVAARADADRTKALIEQGVPRTKMQISAASLEPYVGHYSFTAGPSLEVTREDNRLFVQLAGQPRIEVYPQAEGVFFWRIGPVQISFVMAGVACTGAILHEDGREQLMARVSADEASRSAAFVRERLADQQRPRTEIAIEPAVLDDYVGRYQFTPRAIVTVTRDGDRLFVAFGAQPAAEVFPESDETFFWKTLDRQISFARDQSGPVDQAVLQMTGRLIPLARMAGESPQLRRSA